jgi:hypothetical protein
MTLFPSVRISDLKRDVALKKARLDESAAAVRSTMVSQANPSNLIKHPSWLIGGVISTLATFKIGGKVIGWVAKNKLRGGWIGKIAATGGILAAKKLLPLATAALMKGLESFTKKRRAD